MAHLGVLRSGVLATGLALLLQVGCETAASSTESPRSAYDAFVARLAAGDAVGALSYVHPERRAEYEKVFSLIGDKLPHQAELLAGAELAEESETRAVFHVQRTEMYRGESVVNTYPIVMVRDGAGRWRIWTY